MKHKILFALFALLGCLALSPQIKAQAVDGYTSIDYDDSSGYIDAYSETTLDYDVACYYDAYVSMLVRTDSGSLVVSDSDRDYDGFGFISVEDFFFADAGTTYTADGTHSAWANYSDYDYYWDDYGRYRTYYYWYDVWFFGFYEPYGIYYPWYYYFANPYGFTSQTRRTPRVRLGTTHDQASVSTPNLKPHHVVVQVDQTTSNSCGSLLRQLQLRAVTKSGRTVTGESVGETFPPQNDTCNSSTVSPSGCSSLDSGGTFQDATSVGCPAPDSTCGFAMKDIWRWCASSGTPVPIATLNKDVRKFSIHINGSEQFTGHPSIFR